MTRTFNNGTLADVEGTSSGKFYTSYNDTARYNGKYFLDPNMNAEGCSFAMTDILGSVTQTSYDESYHLTGYHYGSYHNMFAYIGHVSHAQSVEVDYNGNGGVIFHPPSQLPAGFFDSGIEQYKPKQAPPPLVEYDLTGTFLPQQTPWQAFWGSIENSVDTMQDAAIDIIENLDHHDALDAAGMIPVFGEAFDLVNAAVYLYEGDYVNAGMGAAAAIPFIGNFATGAKWTKKAVKAVDNIPGASQISKSLKMVIGSRQKTCVLVMSSWEQMVNFVFSPILFVSSMLRISQYITSPSMIITIISSLHEMMSMGRLVFWFIMRNTKENSNVTMI